jgi:hypothetical protein
MNNEDKSGQDSQLKKEDGNCEESEDEYVNFNQDRNWQRE